MVPGAPSVEGSPAAGFVVGRITSDPAKVEVTGPASAVDRVTEATTETVSVAGARATVTDTVTVGFTDPSIRVTSPLPAAVRIQVQISSAKR